MVHEQRDSDSPSEACFRALWAATSDAAALSDPDGIVLDANPAYAALYGYSLTEVIGVSFSLIFPSAERAEAEAHYRRIFAHPDPPRGYQTRVRRRDGAVREVTVRADFVVVNGKRWALLSTIRDVTDRATAEERLALALEAARMSSWDRDDASGRVFRSAGAPALFGLPAEAVSAGRAAYLAAIHPDDLATVERTDQERERGGAYRVDYRVVHPDGAVRWLRDHGEVRLGPDGSPVRFLGVTQDVTDEKRAGAALRESEARYRGLLERLPALVYEQPFADIPRPRYVNARVTPLLGYAPAEWTVDWLGRVHPDDRKRVTAESDAADVTGEPFCSEYREQAKDGRWVWVRDEAVLVRREDGSPDYWLGVKVDITVQKRAEDALRLQAGHLAAVVAAQAEIAAVGPDPETVMRLVAERALVLTGANGAALALRDGDDSVFRVADGFQACAEGLRVPLASSLTGACLRTGLLQRTDDASVSERGARRTGADLPTRAAVVAPLRHDGRVIGALLIASTEPGVFGDREVYSLQLLAEVAAAALAHAEAFAAMRAARDTAEMANRLKSAFLSTMSHELRTPLNAIIGYADLVLDPSGAPLTPRQRADVEQIAAGGGRLLGLVNDVLDLSRIEAGELELVVEPVALEPVLASVVAEVAPQAIAKGISLVAAPLPPLPILLADPARLHQILLNLAGNAVKFTARGAVTFRARAVADGVEITVTDTGIGIAPGALPHIFDEFRQADETTTRRFGGSGLGLAITKRLVKLHGGTIRAESTAGAGSTFTVTLPTVSPP